jgi:hypothetical protein
MKFLTPITLAALCGFAEAAKQSADVFNFGAKQTSTEQPQLPREVARHILLQRTSRSRYGSDLRDLPKSVDTESAVEYISRYGKSPAPLFTKSDAIDASQLVVILEGVDKAAAGQIKEALTQSGQDVAFTISDPPSATANKRLMTLFQNMGVASQQQCDFASAINPFDSNCWTGSSSVVKYDVSKSPATLTSILSNLPRLAKFASAGDLEALLIVLPESSRYSSLSHWSVAAAAALHSQRSAGAETVFTSSSVLSGPSSSKATRKPKAVKIPQCFASFNTCMTQTGNCSAHGECVNKYAEGDKSSCFACSCKATILKAGEGAEHKGRQTQHWGGNIGR